MSDMMIVKYHDWNIRIRYFSPRHYQAWASKSELTADSCLYEPHDKDIWFEFGESATEAYDKLKLELDEVDNAQI